MTRRALAICIAGFFTVAAAFAIRYGYGILLPEMVQDLDLSKAQAGSIYAGYFVAYTLASPLLGVLTDRYDYRVLLTLFSALLASGALLMGSADTLWQARLYFSVCGLGHAACWAPVAALVQRWVPQHRRGTALSMVNIGLGMGIPAWSLLLPVIVSSASWRSGWLAMGGFGLAVAALNFILVRNPEPNAAAHQSTGAGKSHSLHNAYRAILGNRQFWIIGGAYLFVGINVIVPFAFLPVHARESLGLPYGTAAGVVAAIAFCGIAGQLTLGPLSDRVGRIRVMIWCGLIMALACVGFALADRPLVLYGAAAFFGLGYGAVWPAYGAAASDFFSNRHTGGVVGLWTVFLGIGSVISPVVCGWLVDQFARYTEAMLVGTASGLLSALILAVGLSGRR